jgi:hypothetical protein
MQQSARQLRLARVEGKNYMRARHNAFWYQPQEFRASAAQVAVLFGGSGQANAAGWFQCRCPGHDDHQFSLSLKDTPRGVVLKCFAGCDPAVVKQAIRETVQGQLLLHVPNPEAKSTKTDLAKIAARIWYESQPILGTVAERYLRGRGITLALPNTLRFHPHLYHKESNTYASALVALVQDAHGAPTGVHRTWISADGSGKANLEPVRKALSATTGHAVHLGEPNNQLLVAEGVETTLSAVQLWGTSDFAGWAALSAPGLAALIVPQSVTRVLIASDDDAAGRDAAGKLFDRIMREHARRLAIIGYPQDGLNDFNDLLVRS